MRAFFKHLIIIYIRKTKKILSLKGIAIALVLCLLMQSVVYAAPSFPTLTNLWSQNLKIDFVLPKSIGHIEDSYKAPNSEKTIVLIQDAHTNASAQINIAKMLDIILDEEKINLVFLEAGNGDLSLSELRQDALLNRRKQVGLKYINKGLLQGSEYFDLTTEHEFKLWGVENRDLYDQSLTIYKSVADQRDDFNAYLARIKVTTDFLKTKIFNPQLQKLDQQRTDHQNGNSSLIEYASVIASRGAGVAILASNGSTIGRGSRLPRFARNDDALAEYPNLKRLLALKDMEASIDFNKANNEYDLVIESNVIASREAGAAISSSNVLENSQNARLPRFARLPAGQAGNDNLEMHDAIINAAKDKELYPNLAQYIDYLKKVKALNHTKVLTEIELLEREVFSQHIQKDDERYLLNVSKSISILEALIDLQLQPKDFATIKSYLSNFDLGVITGFLNQKILELKDHQDKAIFLDEEQNAFIQRALGFYDLTLQRDSAFVRNALQKMDRDEQSQAVLITGGYHANNLKAQLKQRGISFVSIIPTITHETNSQNYENLLLGQSNNAQDSKEMNSSSMSLRPAAEPGSRMSLQELRQQLLNAASVRDVSEARMAQKGLVEQINAELPEHRRFAYWLHLQLPRAVLLLSAALTMMSRDERYLLWVGIPAGLFGSLMFANALAREYLTRNDTSRMTAKELDQAAKELTFYTRGNDSYQAARMSSSGEDAAKIEAAWPKFLKKIFRKKLEESKRAAIELANLPINEITISSVRAMLVLALDELTVRGFNDSQIKALIAKLKTIKAESGTVENSLTSSNVVLEHFLKEFSIPIHIPESASVGKDGVYWTQKILFGKGTEVIGAKHRLIKVFYGNEVTFSTNQQIEVIMFGKQPQAFILTNVRYSELSKNRQESVDSNYTDNIFALPKIIVPFESGDANLSNVSQSIANWYVKMRQRAKETIMQDYRPIFTIHKGYASSDIVLLPGMYSPKQMVSRLFLSGIRPREKVAVGGIGRILNRIETITNERVWSIGSGSLVDSIATADRLGVTTNILASDIGASELAAAKYNLSTSIRGNQITISYADLLDLPPGITGWTDENVTPKFERIHFNIPVALYSDFDRIDGDATSIDPEGQLRERFFSGVENYLATDGILELTYPEQASFIYSALSHGFEPIFVEGTDISRPINRKAVENLIKELPGGEAVLGAIQPTAQVQHMNRSEALSDQYETFFDAIANKVSTTEKADYVRFTFVLMNDERRKEMADIIHDWRILSDIEINYLKNKLHEAGAGIAVQAIYEKYRTKNNFHAALISKRALEMTKMRDIFFLLSQPVSNFRFNSHYKKEFPHLAKLSKSQHEPPRMAKGLGRNLATFASAAEVQDTSSTSRMTHSNLNVDSLKGFKLLEGLLDNPMKDFGHWYAGVTIDEVMGNEQLAKIGRAEIVAGFEWLRGNGFVLFEEDASRYRLNAPIQQMVDKNGDRIVSNPGAEYQTFEIIERAVFAKAESLRSVGRMEDAIQLFQGALGYLQSTAEDTQTQEKLIQKRIDEIENFLEPISDLTQLDKYDYYFFGNRKYKISHTLELDGYHLVILEGTSVTLANLLLLFKFTPEIGYKIAASASQFQLSGEVLKDPRTTTFIKSEANLERVIGMLFAHRVINKWNSEIITSPLAKRMYQRIADKSSDPNYPLQVRLQTVFHTTSHYIVELKRDVDWNDPEELYKRLELAPNANTPKMAKSIMEADTVDEVLTLMGDFERSLKVGSAFDGLLPVGLDGDSTDTKIARPWQMDQIWKNMIIAYGVDAADPLIYLEGFAIKIAQLYADTEQPFEELHPMIDKMKVLVDLYNKLNEFAPRPLYLEELLIHPTSIPLDNRTFVKWTNALAHYPDWIVRKIILVRLFNAHNHIIYFLNAEMHDYEDAQAIKSLLSKGIEMAHADKAIRRVVVNAVVSLLVRHSIDNLPKKAPYTWGVIKDNAVILEQWTRESRLEDAKSDTGSEQNKQISTMGLAVALFRFLEASLSKYETRESVVEIIESQELLRKLTANEDTVIVTSKDKALQVMGSEMSSEGDIRFLTEYDQFYEIALDKLKSTRMAATHSEISADQGSSRNLATFTDSAEPGARMLGSMTPLDSVGIRSLLNELVLEMNGVLYPHNVQLFIGDDAEILGNQGYIIGKSTPVIESNPPRAIDYYQISVDLGRIDVEKLFVELESQFGQFELSDSSEWKKVKAGFRTSRLRTELRKANHIVRKSEYDEAVKLALEADVAVYPKDYAGKILERIAKKKAAELELVQKNLEKESKEAYAKLKKEANRLGIRIFHYDTKESLTPRVTKAQIAENVEIDITKAKLKKLGIRVGGVKSLDKLWAMLQLHDLTVFPNLKSLAMQYKQLKHYKHVESITYGGFNFNINDPNLHSFLVGLSRPTSTDDDVIQLTPRRVMNTGAVRIGQYKEEGASKDQEKHLQYQVMQNFAGQWVIPMIRKIGHGSYDIEFDVKSKLTGKRFMVAKYAFVRKNKVWVKERQRLMTFSQSPLAREFFSGFMRNNLPKSLKFISNKKGHEYGIFKEGKVYFWQNVWITIPANVQNEDLMIKVNQDHKGRWIASLYLNANPLRPQIWLKSVYLTQRGRPVAGFGKPAPFEGYKHIIGEIPTPSNRSINGAKDFQNIDWIARGEGESPIEDEIQIEKMSDPGLYSWKGEIIRPWLGPDFVAGTTRREWVAFDIPGYPDARGVVYTNSDHPDKPIAHLLYYNNRFHEPQVLDYPINATDHSTTSGETGARFAQSKAPFLHTGGVKIGSVDDLLEQDRDSPTNNSSLPDDSDESARLASNSTPSKIATGLMDSHRGLSRNLTTFADNADSGSNSAVEATRMTEFEIVDLLGDREAVDTKITRSDWHVPIIFTIFDKRPVPLGKYENILIVGGLPAEIEAIIERNARAHITAIDIDHGQLEDIQLAFKDRPDVRDRLSLYRADMTALDPNIFIEESFDFIFISGLEETAFYNIEQANRVLPLIIKEKIRLLKKGGIAFHNIQNPAKYHRNYENSRLITPLLWTADQIMIKQISLRPYIANLVDRLKNGDALSRQYAAKTIGQIGPLAIDAVWELVNRVRQRDGDVNSDEDSPAKNAYQALLQLGPAVIPHLIWHLDDPTNPDRQSFAKMLAHFGELAIDAVPALVRISEDFGDADANYKLVIISALAHVGKNHPQTIPILTNVVQQDSDLDVRSSATKILKDFTTSQTRMANVAKLVPDHLTDYVPRMSTREPDYELVKKTILKLEEKLRATLNVTDKEIDLLDIAALRQQDLMPFVIGKSRNLYGPEASELIMIQGLLGYILSLNEAIAEWKLGQSSEVIDQSYKILASIVIANSAARTGLDRDLEADLLDAIIQFAKPQSPDDANIRDRDWHDSYWHWVLANSMNGGHAGLVNLQAELNRVGNELFTPEENRNNHWSPAYQEILLEGIYRAQTYSASDVFLKRAILEQASLLESPHASELAKYLLNLDDFKKALPSSGDYRVFWTYTDIWHQDDLEGDYTAGVLVDKRPLFDQPNDFDGLSRDFTSTTEDSGRSGTRMEKTQYSEYFDYVVGLLDEVERGGDSGARAIEKLLNEQAAEKKLDENDRTLRPVELIVGHLRNNSDFLPDRADSVIQFFSSLGGEALETMIFSLVSSAVGYLRSSGDSSDWSRVNKQNAILQSVYARVDIETRSAMRATISRSTHLILTEDTRSEYSKWILEQMEGEISVEDAEVENNRLRMEVIRQVFTAEVQRLMWYVGVIGLSDMVYTPNLVDIGDFEIRDLGEESEVAIRDGETTVFNLNALNNADDAELKYLFWKHFAGPVYENEVIKLWDYKIKMSESRFILNRWTTFVIAFIEAWKYKRLGLNSRLLKGKKVLELGMGYGKHLLAIKYLGADKVVGIDGSEAAINLSQRRIATFQSSKGISLQNVKLLKLGESTIGDGEPFDHVLIDHMFHYIPEPLQRDFIKAAIEKTHANGSIIYIGDESGPTMMLGRISTLFEEAGLEVQVLQHKGHALTIVAQRPINANAPRMSVDLESLNSVSLGDNGSGRDLARDKNNATLAQSEEPFLHPRGVKGAEEAQGSRMADVGHDGIYRPEDDEYWDRIAKRILWTAVQEIHQANKEKHKVKTGGHQAASASSLHIMTALELIHKSGVDYIAHKPHAAPIYHAIQYLLGNLDKELLYRLRETAIDPEPLLVSRAKDLELSDSQRLELKHLNQRLMQTLPESARSQFDTLGLHSYPGMIDPLDIDIPTGSVGIGPAVTIALAIKQKWLKAQGLTTADSHFYAVVGDGEFGEGNYLEALSLAAEFEVNNITHIVDFNRLSLDGVMHERTFERIKQTYEANGWRVIELKWGRRMQTAFDRHDGGELFFNVISDLKQQEYELLTAQKPSYIRKYLIDRGTTGLEAFLASYNDEELYTLATDLGGHDTYNLARAMNEAKSDETQPVAIIAYTHKGWGIDPLIGNPASHGLLLTDNQIEDLRVALDIGSDEDFPIFDEALIESQILQAIKERVNSQREERLQIKQTNAETSFPKELVGDLPHRLMPKASAIKNVSTQVYMGTIIGMMRRIADTPAEDLPTDAEKALRPIANRYLTVSPDVATSTQLGPGLDQNIFGPEQDHDWFETVDLGRALDDKKMKATPNTTRILKGARHFEVGIAEMNALTLAIALGKDFVGTMLFPLVTVYDMFLFRRALDIIFYGQYWLSNFLMIGTPSGSSLSPEGAQHQSGIAPVIGRSLVNTITWEPAFPQELEFIEADRLKRVVSSDTKGRNAVYYRLSTVPVEKAELLKRLKDQSKYQDLGEEAIMDLWGQDVLKGGYRLVDYSNRQDYQPEVNVVNLVVTGSMMQEALIASDALRQSGIYANIIIVSSPNLILDTLAEKTGFEQLKALIPSTERPFTPVVTVADAPKAYLAGIGDILGLGLGVEALGLKKNGTSTRDIERIYVHHGISRVHIAETAAAQLMIRDQGQGRARPFIDSDWGGDHSARMTDPTNGDLLRLGALISQSRMTEGDHVHLRKRLLTQKQVEEYGFEIKNASMAIQMEGIAMGMPAYALSRVRRVDVSGVGSSIQFLDEQGRKNRHMPVTERILVDQFHIDNQLSIRKQGDQVILRDLKSGEEEKAVSTTNLKDLRKFTFFEKTKLGALFLNRLLGIEAVDGQERRTQIHDAVMELIKNDLGHVRNSTNKAINTNLFVRRKQLVWSKEARNEIPNFAFDIYTEKEINPRFMVLVDRWNPNNYTVFEFVIDWSESTPVTRIVSRASEDEIIRELTEDDAASQHVPLISIVDGARFFRDMMRRLTFAKVSEHRFGVARTMVRFGVKDQQAREINILRHRQAATSRVLEALDNTSIEFPITIFESNVPIRPKLDGQVIEVRGRAGTLPTHLEHFDGRERRIFTASPGTKIDSDVGPVTMYKEIDPNQALTQLIFKPEGEVEVGGLTGLDGQLIAIEGTDINFETLVNQLQYSRHIQVSPKLVKEFGLTDEAIAQRKSNPERMGFKLSRIVDGQIYLTSREHLSDIQGMESYQLLAQLLDQEITQPSTKISPQAQLGTSLGLSPTNEHLATPQAESLEVFDQEVNTVLASNGLSSEEIAEVRKGFEQQLESNSARSHSYGWTTSTRTNHELKQKTQLEAMIRRQLIEKIQSDNLLEYSVVTLGIGSQGPKEVDEFVAIYKEILEELIEDEAVPTPEEATLHLLAFEFNPDLVEKYSSHFNAVSEQLGTNTKINFKVQAHLKLANGLHLDQVRQSSLQDSPSEPTAFQNVDLIMARNLTAGHKHLSVNPTTDEMYGRVNHYFTMVIHWLIVNNLIGVFGQKNHTRFLIESTNNAADKNEVESHERYFRHPLLTNMSELDEWSVDPNLGFYAVNGSSDRSFASFLKLYQNSLQWIERNQKERTRMTTQLAADVRLSKAQAPFSHPGGVEIGPDRSDGPNASRMAKQANALEDNGIVTEVNVSKELIGELSPFILGRIQQDALSFFYQFAENMGDQDVLDLEKSVDGGEADIQTYQKSQIEDLRQQENELEALIERIQQLGRLDSEDEGVLIAAEAKLSQVNKSLQDLVDWNLPSDANPLVLENSTGIYHSRMTEMVGVRALKDMWLAHPHYERLWGVAKKGISRYLKPTVWNKTRDWLGIGWSSQIAEEIATTILYLPDSKGKLAWIAAISELEDTVGQFNVNWDKEENINILAYDILLETKEAMIRLITRRQFLFDSSALMLSILTAGATKSIIWAAPKKIKRPSRAVYGVAHGLGGGSTGLTPQYIDDIIRNYLVERYGSLTKYTRLTRPTDIEHPNQQSEVIPGNRPATQKHNFESTRLVLLPAIDDWLALKVWEDDGGSSFGYPSRSQVKLSDDIKISSSTAGIASRMAWGYDFSLHQDMLVNLMSLAGVKGGFPEWGKQTRLTPEQFMRGKRVLNIGVETFDGLRGGGKINPRNLVSHYKELGIDITGLTRSISENDDDAQLVLGDARAMPFEDNSFDMAISINFYDDIYIQLMLMLENEKVGIEHFAEFYTRIAQEVRRVLVEGGQYLVSNVDGEMFKNVMIPIFESHGFEVIRPLPGLVSGEGTYLFVNHKEISDSSTHARMARAEDASIKDMLLEQIKQLDKSDRVSDLITWIINQKRAMALSDTKVIEALAEIYVDYGGDEAQVLKLVSNVVTAVVQDFAWTNKFEWQVIIARDSSNQLVRKELLVNSKNGIHLVPSSVIVELAEEVQKQLGVKVYFYTKDRAQVVSAENIFELTSLALYDGDTVEAAIVGNQDQALLEEVTQLFEALLQDREALSVGSSDTQKFGPYRAQVANLYRQYLMSDDSLADEFKPSAEKPRMAIDLRAIRIFVEHASDELKLRYAGVFAHEHLLTELQDIAIRFKKLDFSPHGIQAAEEMQIEKMASGQLHAELLLAVYRFSNRAYEGYAPAQKFLLELGRIEAARTDFSHRRSEALPEYLNESNGALHKFPYLDIGAGITAAYDMAYMQNGQYILADRSYYTVGFLNEAAKIIGVDAHVQVLQMDILNPDIIKTMGPFRQIRMGRVFKYAEVIGAQDLTREVATETAQMDTYQLFWSEKMRLWFNQIASLVVPEGSITIEEDKSTSSHWERLAREYHRMTSAFSTHLPGWDYKVGFADILTLDTTHTYTLAATVFTKPKELDIKFVESAIEDLAVARVTTEDLETGEQDQEIVAKLEAWRLLKRAYANKGFKSAEDSMQFLRDALVHIRHFDLDDSIGKYFYDYINQALALIPYIGRPSDAGVPNQLGSDSTVWWHWVLTLSINGGDTGLRKLQSILKLIGDKEFNQDAGLESNNQSYIALQKIVLEAIYLAQTYNSEDAELKRNILNEAVAHKSLYVKRLAKHLRTLDPNQGRHSIRDYKLLLQFSASRTPSGQNDYTPIIQLNEIESIWKPTFARMTEAKINQQGLLAGIISEQATHTTTLEEIGGARLAANTTPIEVATDLVELLSDFSDVEVLKKHRLDLAIFLNGLRESKPGYFDGSRVLMLGKTRLYPGTRLDVEGREVFTLVGLDDILAEFPIGVKEAEGIAKQHQSEVKALNQKYVHGSAIAYVMVERESRREYETLTNRVDASGIKQALPKAVSLKSSIIDLDMPRAALKQQLRLFIATFKKIQQAAPSTTFHFDAGFAGHADVIKAIAKEYGVDSFVSLDEPTAAIQVIIDSLSVENVNGILIDIDQIQANELALGLPKAIYQGLKEAALFTNPETKQLDFESVDPTETTRLRHQRNQSSKEPLNNDTEYIELISGSMSLTRRQKHIWNAIIPIPMDYMLRAAQRTIQQVVQST